MRKLLVLLAAVGLLAGACGSDSKKDDKADTVGGGDATTTTAAESRDDGASSALKAKLLTVADLPAGYKVSDDNGSDDDTKEDESSSGCPQLDEYDKKYSKAADEDAEIDFAKGEVTDAGIPAGGLHFLNQSVERWSSDAKADESFDAAVAAFNSCKTFNSTDDDGSQISGSMSPLSFPKLEDDTFAVHIKFSVSSEGEKVDFDGDMVAVRSGKFVGLILAMSFGGPTMAQSDFESLVRKAAAKL